MGNQNDLALYEDRPLTNHSNKKWSKFKSKLHKKRKPSISKTNTDDFIIKYRHENKENESQLDIESLDQRRVVFVSLIGLFRSWRKCPSMILYTSMILLPLKKEWIYHPSKHSEEILSCFISQTTTFSNIPATKQFIQLIKWKDSQELVVWMLDDYEMGDDDQNPLINPFWYCLSEKISNLHNPITRKKYDSLILDERWWNNEKQFVSKYDVDSSAVFNELFFLTMKYKVIQEILFQSNPISLRPVTEYGNVDLSIMRTISDSEIKRLHIKPVQNKYVHHSDGDGSWFIADDYDPFDVDSATEDIIV